jgi:hypothetical protein
MVPARTQDCGEDEEREDGHQVEDEGRQHE